MYNPASILYLTCARVKRPTADPSKLRLAVTVGILASFLSKVIYKEVLTTKSLKIKGVYPIIFVPNIFPYSHLIQKCIHNENWEKYSTQR